MGYVVYANGFYPRSPPTHKGLAKDYSVMASKQFYSLSEGGINRVA
jgi:hypothetical protein